LADNDVLRGHFVQERHLQGFTQALRSEGRFVLTPSHGLIWQTEKPFPVTTIITPNGLAQEVNGSKTLNLPAAKLPFLTRLYHMLGGALSGDWNALEQDFTIKRSGDDQHWQLDLLPKQTDNPAMPFRAIVVKGGRFVDEVTLDKPEGDFDKLMFSEQSLSSAPLAPDEAAIFDQTPK
jgi:hypothetical protein